MIMVLMLLFILLGLVGKIVQTVNSSKFDTMFQNYGILRVNKSKSGIFDIFLY